MDVKKLKKLDIHAHAIPFPEYAPKWNMDHSWISGEELIEIYDKLNVEQGVLLPLASPESHFQTFNNAEIKYLVDKHPDRFLWFCSVDPRACYNLDNADLSLVINHYKSLGAKGVGEVTAQLYIDDAKMDNLFYHARECDMPVTIHISPRMGYTYGMVDEIGLPRLEKMLKKHKKLKILGHSQAFWAEFSADVEEKQRSGYPKGKVTEGRVAKLMRDYEGLYCDFSAGSGLNALSRDPEYTARFIEEFSDRILWGYDVCASFNTHQYDMNAFLDKFYDDGYISAENYYKFVRGNAIKLLNLDLDK
ncbi:MAG: amidohydrolase family protein [Clostridia bacterium]|nr:amidohydrolase family protein [Clostridia bacterium]